MNYAIMNHNTLLILYTILFNIIIIDNRYLIYCVWWHIAYFQVDIIMHDNILWDVGISIVIHIKILCISIIYICDLCVNSFVK